MKLIVQYRLRPETDVQEYLRWSREQDHPAVRAADGVRAFDVCLVEVAAGESPVTVVELVDVESWEAWEAATRTPPFQALGPDFKRLVDVDSVVILRGEPVVDDLRQRGASVGPAQQRMTSLPPYADAAKNRQ